MIAVDCSILVHSHREDAPLFEAARDCVRSLAEGRQRWAIPWPCLYEFAAVVTHPGIFATPTPAADAVRQIAAWLGSPTLTLLAEGRGFWHHLCAQLLLSKAAGPSVHDARVAALCLSHGVSEFWSVDRDLRAFPGVKVRNPLLLA